ncbi:MAG: presenilin family intramembrane aspartyl protease [Candidatus Woesearchaeota archaeon]
MKHTLKITIILALAFLFSQVIGLAITNEYIDHDVTSETGNVTWSALPYDIARPEVEESSSFIFIIAAILLGTLLIFLIIKFGKMLWWKIWFFLAVTVTLVVAFNSFMPQVLAGLLALILASYKIFKPNVYLHNITELFIYGGLAAIFVPIMNVFSVIMLLILISIYDMIAVWKSGHMIKLAKFQTKSKVFAGLLIPYNKPKSLKNIPKSQLKKVKVNTAVLGGGDIGFPLIFAGVIMKGLMITHPQWLGFLKALIIPIFTSIALLWLLVKSEKNKFYPAMPFLTAGCFAGYIVLLLVNLIG